MKALDEKHTFIARLNVMDDPFFQKIAENPAVCEEILRILLQKPKLKIIQTNTQLFLRNLSAHSVILDALCTDETGAFFNIEIQKDDKKGKSAKAQEYQKRVRFHLSNMDTMLVEKGTPYQQLPDLYAVFISEIDPFQQNCTIYHIHRAIAETGTVVENGVHEIYANTAVNDGTDIAQLLQYFKNTTDTNATACFPNLVKQVKLLKETTEGALIMGNVFDEYAELKVKEAEIEFQKKEQEKEKTTAINFLKEGVSVETIAKALPSLSIEFIKQLKQQLPQAKAGFICCHFDFFFCYNFSLFLFATLRPSLRGFGQFLACAALLN